MGRVRTNIRIDGRECWTLFDTGSRNTYVVPDVAALLQVVDLPGPRRVALGGKVLSYTQACTLVARVEGHEIDTHAQVLADIGHDEDGRRIEILFGALAMQQWGIRPVPDEERLDLTHYSREFVEF